MPEQLRQLPGAKVRGRIGAVERPVGASPDTSYSPKRPPQWFEVTEDYTDIEGKRYRKGDILTQRQGRNVQVQDKNVGWRNLSSRQSAYRRMRNPDDDTRRAMQALERQSRERGVDIRYRGPIRNKDDLQAREAFGVFYIQNKRKQQGGSRSRATAAFLTSIGWDTGWNDPEDVWAADDEAIDQWITDYKAHGQ